MSRSLNHRLLALLAVTNLLAISAPAHAGLVGSSVNLGYRYQATALDALQTTVDTVVVGGGVEATCPGAFNLCTMLTAATQMVDIADQSITYRYVGGGSGFNAVYINGFDFQALNLGSAITDIGLSTDIAGLDLSRLSFTADSLQVDMRGLVLLAPGNTFTVQLLTATVPEPTTAFLAVLGLAGLLASRRPGSAA
jgi:hypothetical protein